MDDVKIIELYFSRSEDAIKQTDIKYGKSCFALAFNVVGNTSDAEECVNDTYLAVWNQIPPTRPNRFAAFLYKIVRNISLNRLDFIMAQKRSPTAEIPFHELETVIHDKRLDPETSDMDLGNSINEFLMEAKEDQRNVFIRRYWFYESIEDIAKRYSFSESKVKSMLFHMRNKLRNHLEKEGIYV